MAGITAFGAYIPPTRLPLAHLTGRPVKEGGPEKSVAWNDEDSVTMAVTAGVSCLEGLDRGAVDAVLRVLAPMIRRSSGPLLVSPANKSL